jgi:hypothetical protein
VNPSFTAKANIKKVTFAVKIKVGEILNMSIEILECEVKQIENIDVDVDVPGPAFVDWMVSEIISLVTSFLEDTIRNQINSAIKIKLQEVNKDLNQMVK